MDKIIVSRIAQTVPVLADNLKLDTTLEQFTNNIIGVTFKKSINMGKSVPEQLIDNSKPIDDLSLLKNVLDQNHGSVLEHVYVSYAIINASRSYLAQHTRHRMASYTSSSQHYIDHTNMNDAEIPLEIIELDRPEVLDLYLNAYNEVKDVYNKLVNEYNIDHSIARQLLPNAQRNTLIVTANLRSWLNFMNLRLCNRNTSEIQYVAYLIREDLKKLFPLCVNYMVPDCVLHGKCSQKEMSCKLGWSEEMLHKKFANLTKDKLK